MGGATRDACGRELPLKNDCRESNGPVLASRELTAVLRKPSFRRSRVFNNMARFVFRFVSGSFFPQLRIFNNFSASLYGSFSAIHVAFLCIFNNFSGSFFKKGILFLFSVPRTG